MFHRARPWAATAVIALAGVAVLLAGCSSSSTSSGQPGSTITPVRPGQPGAGTPQAQTDCTKQAGDAATMANVVRAASPGDRICLTGDMSDARLDITNSGTSDRPIMVLGGGRTTLAGVTIEANNVAVDGVAVQRPEAPGLSLAGNNISVTNNTVTRPHGGDGDGIRFWGNNITIAHNTISDTRGQDKRHADCMQTFATDSEHPASQDIKIDSNRCEKIDNICLIAEGPNSEAGDGSGDGKSARFEFTNNYCDNKASQAVFLDDISDVKIANNQVVGRIDKAFAIQNNSTGALVQDNKIGSSIGYEVGMDDSSEAGYRGPEPGGEP